MSLERIPKSIARAIAKISASVDAVAKTQKNQHGNYQFSSTDDIYAAVARKLGEVGLVIMALERECETVRVEKDGKTVQWLRASYQFVLATDEDTWTDSHLTRSVYTQITGPQSFQAAQSYCEKSFLRSLFKLPSGDVDLDSMPQAESEEAQAALNGNGGKRKSSAAAKREGFDKTFNEIKNKIETAPSADVLEQIPDLYAEELGQMPRAWNEIIKDTYEDRMSELRPQ
jgi:hypothetical protein